MTFDPDHICPHVCVTACLGKESLALVVGSSPRATNHGTTVQALVHGNGDGDKLKPSPS